MLEILSEPLTVDQIDFRVQSINKGGYATILAYKDARVDMNRLNQVFGVGMWQRKHEVINGNLYCSVGTYNKEIGDWAWIQDVGTPSNTEQAKGNASDSFKRACFNLGIGIELYDYPVIQIKLNSNEFTTEGNKVKQTWNLKLKEWTWFTQFTNGELTCIAAKDEKSQKRFQWGQYREGGDTSPQRAAYENAEYITQIKEAVSNNDTGTVKAVWGDIPEQEQHALWVAPSKGGVFTTEERAFIQNNATGK